MTTAAAVIDRTGLDQLIAALRRRGYRTRGPVVRDGAIVAGDVGSGADLPAGWTDEQGAGSYRLVPGDGAQLFGWAVGPGSWKAELFPPRATVWRGRLSGDGVELAEVAGDGPPVAIIGARPCDIVGLQVLDGVLADGPVPDPDYRARRSAAFVVAVECGTPGGSCFCTSMGTGPAAGDGFDLCLTELTGDGEPRYLVRVGSAAGDTVLGEVRSAAVPGPGDTAARQAVLDRAVAAMSGRTLDTDGLPALLARNQDHPHWDRVAERCLACGNCTLVCPTCFCSSVEDTTDIGGGMRRDRRWASCFELDYSYLHGGPVRSSIGSRYRQWITHKLSTWVDQFGTVGCVGCGRCVTWCPVGIDITVEAAAIRASDRGAARPFAAPSGGGRP